MTTTVIVDDTDPTITYGGRWILSGSVVAGSNEYNNTVHATREDGASITYQFKGSGISVYGTVDSPASKGIPAPVYKLDDFAPTGPNAANVTAIPDIQSHLLLYQSPPLLDTTHTLNISISNLTIGGPNFYFDFFTIDVSTPEPMSHILVDDRSSDIHYSGDWTDSHSFNSYLGTDRMAADSGNSIATFAFTGQAIDVYGILAPANDPQTSIDFSIDSGEATLFQATYSAIMRRHTRLFTVSGLSQGSHNITIQGRNSAHWWMDYLVYTPSSGGSSTSTPGGVEQSNGNSVSPGAIAGGVVGGVVGLALLALLFFLLWRRRREKVPETPAVGITPSERLTAGSGTADARGFLDGTSYGSATSPQTPEGRVLGGGLLHADRKGAIQRSPVTRDEGTTVSDTVASSTEPATPPGLPVLQVRELDGGVRLAGSSDHSSDIAPSTLPPSYARY